MERTGVVISCLWLLIIVTLLVLKWDDVIALSLNEWGDFLAGVTAPLAFFWLIVGYGLQRKELKKNTDALLFQREELENQAKQLAEQTKYMAVSARAESDQAHYVRQKQKRQRIEAIKAARRNDDLK